MTLYSHPHQPGPVLKVCISAAILLEKNTCELNISRRFFPNSTSQLKALEFAPPAAKFPVIWISMRHVSVNSLFAFAWNPHCSQTPLIDELKVKVV